MSSTALKLECWEYYIGILRGVHQALGAPTIARDAVDWIHNEVVVTADDAEQNGKMDMLIETAKKFDSSGFSAPADGEEEDGAPKRRLWTAEEDERLIPFIRDGRKSSSLLDDFPGRSSQTIYQRMTRLKTLGRV